MSADSPLRADFDALSEFGRLAQGGWSRPAFGPEDCRAHEWFCRRATEAGLTVRTDGMGNVIARLQGSRGGPAIAIGSHLDTVHSGGAFDGAIGVLIGLEAARNIRRSEKNWPVPVEVIAFRDEEGRFGAFTGSLAMTGKLSPEEIGRRRDVDGLLLTDALRTARLDCDAAARAGRDAADFAAYLEVHIEQGSVLERAGIGLGVVSSIVGQERLSIRFTGAADHAGTTPMDMRRDAFAAAARFADRFREIVVTEGDGTARGTIGIVKVSPNQGNVVPREVRLGLEIRDISASRLKRLGELTGTLAEEAATALGVDVSLRGVYSSPPIGMSETLRNMLENAARSLGLDTLDMPCGANHDAGIMAAMTPVAMLLVPSEGGRSHCPEENTDWTHIEAAARVLETTVRDIAHRMIEGDGIAASP